MGGRLHEIPNWKYFVLVSHKIYKMAQDFMVCHQGSFILSDRVGHQPLPTIHSHGVKKSAEICWDPVNPLAVRSRGDWEVACPFFVFRCNGKRSMSTLCVSDYWCLFPLIISWDRLFPMVKSSICMEDRINPSEELLPFIVIFATLWWTNIAIEHGPVEIVDLPIKNGRSFHSKMWQFTRGYPPAYQTMACRKIPPFF